MQSQHPTCSSQHKNAIAEPLHIKCDLHISAKVIASFRCHRYGIWLHKYFQTADAGERLPPEIICMAILFMTGVRTHTGTSICNTATGLLYIVSYCHKYTSVVCSLEALLHIGLLFILLCYIQKESHTVNVEYLFLNLHTAGSCIKDQLPGWTVYGMYITRVITTSYGLHGVQTFKLIKIFTSRCAVYDYVSGPGTTVDQTGVYLTSGHLDPTRVCPHRCMHLMLCHLCHTLASSPYLRCS